MTILKLSRWVLDKFTNSQTPKPPALTEIGMTQPYCPHCVVALSKMPGRKITCKVCCGAIYSRVRPIDNTKALFRPDQLSMLEEQWAVENGHWESFNAGRTRLADQRHQTRKMHGKEPSDHDVIWALYNKRSEEHFLQVAWGKYSNNQRDMAQLLVAEQQYKGAIGHFSVAAYFTVNGCLNATTMKGEPMSGPAFNWDLKLAHFAPGAIARFNKAIELSKFDEASVRAIFLDFCTAYFNGGYGMPLTPTEAWERIQPELIFG